MKWTVRWLVVIRRGPLFSTICALVLVAGCGAGDQRTDSADPNAAVQERASWPPAMLAQIDSGNAAIRADAFEVARRHFAAATELAPQVAAGWFGLYLAEQGLGRATEAAAALERAQGIESDASLIHHEPGEPPS